MASCTMRGSRAAVNWPNWPLTWAPVASKRAVLSYELNWVLFIAL